MNIIEEIFELSSCTEILATNINIYHSLYHLLQAGRADFQDMTNISQSAHHGTQ